MILCIDIGNTRVKWALGELSDLSDSPTWRQTGVCCHDEMHLLQAPAAQLNAQAPIWVANVAGPRCAKNLHDALQGAVQEKRGSIVFAQGSKACAGVLNGYVQPEKLGVDRWCALIGAWQSLRAPALVVSLGTATTIDALDTTGRFLGGMILPGLTLMRDSLAQRTAQLPHVNADDLTGAFSWPTATEMAIAQGALESTAGAIARAWSYLREYTGVTPACLLTGGGAPYLESRLAFTTQIRPTLVLDGLRQMAQAQLGDLA